MSDVEYSRGGTPSASASAGPSTTTMARSGSNSGVGGHAGLPPRERTPEPDEDLRMDSQPTAWLVKVPRFLYEGWSALTEDDLNLGTVRVYDADHKGKQRIELILPSAPDAPIPLPAYDPSVAGRAVKRIPRQYEVKLTSDPQETARRNIFAFRETQEGRGGDGDDDDDDDDGDEELGDGDDEDDGGGNTSANANASTSSPSSSSRTSRYPMRKKVKVTTAFAGKITNEAAVKPILASMSSGGSAGDASSVRNSRGVSPASLAANVASGAAPDAKPSSTLTPEYREILRRRKLEASRPKRTVKMLDESDAGANNMLAAGLGSGLLRGKGSASASSFIVNNGANHNTATGRAKQTEKFARIPRSDLLDLLFGCYERYTYWTLRALREETKQPEAYLRETLSSIADQHKRGPYVGQWSLKPEYVQQRRAEEERRGAAAAAATARTESDVKAEGDQGGSGGDGDDDEMEEVV